MLRFVKIIDPKNAFVDIASKDRETIVSGVDICVSEGYTSLAGATKFAPIDASS